jgi:hypothetical protein
MLAQYEEYREAVAAQIAIGWDQFLMGCWAVEWQERLRGELVSGGDLIPVDIRPTRLCGRRRRRHSRVDRAGSACLSKWLSGGRYGAKG